MSPLPPESSFTRMGNNELHVDVGIEIGYSKGVYNFQMAMTGKSRQIATDRKSAP